MKQTSASGGDIWIAPASVVECASTVLTPSINRKGETLMSELQGPRIPGEERSGGRRRLGLIIGGLLALLLLALLIPFACQALGGGSDSQGQGPGSQRKAMAQEADDGRGRGGARDADGAKNTIAGGTGEDAQAEHAGSEGSQGGKETEAGAARAAASGAEDGAKTPNERGDARTGGELPETGGMSPATLLVAGVALLLMGSTGLSVVVRRRSVSRG
jgi:LPXTG-motif cell wall-anchored protein